MVPGAVIAALDRILATTLASDAQVWLADACTKAAAGEERALFLAFSLAPRRVGRRDLQLDASQRQQADDLVPGWQPWRWTSDQLVRTRLLLSLGTLTAQRFLALLDRLFAAAGLQELVALYQALGLLPHPDALRERAAEGIRSSMRSVFDAVALDNPYPQHHLAEGPWNQMVLKCLFVGSALERIVGLDQRANPRLMRMLCDYAHERWAAKRTVDPQVWRLVGPHADPAALDDLMRVLADGDARERAAAALALVANGTPAARSRLSAAPDLEAAVEGGSLSWETIGRVAP